MAHVVAGTVCVRGAELLLATDLLIVRVPEETVRADANGPVLIGLAHGVPSADDRALADVPALTLAERRVLGGTRFLG